MNNFVYLILKKFKIASFKFIYTDSTEILFSKLRSAGLNYHLPKHKFFAVPYCVGVSINKHCLLTFFHFAIFLGLFDLILYVPVNNFSVMSELVFLG